MSAERLSHRMPWGFDGAMGNRLQCKIMLAETRYPAGSTGELMSVAQMNRAWCKVPAGRSLRPSCNQHAFITEVVSVPTYTAVPTREEKNGRPAALVFTASRKGQPTRFDVGSCARLAHTTVAYLRPDLAATSSVAWAGFSCAKCVLDRSAVC